MASQNASDTQGKLIGIDHEFTRFTSRVFPYSAEQIWKHLTRSYFEFQNYLHASQDTASPVRLVPGSPDGIGGVIEFDWNGSPVPEKLVTQDDQNYVWTIIVPGETAVFKRYRASVALIPLTDKLASTGRTLVTLELKMVLQDPTLAPKVFPAVDALILERLPRLEEYIHLKEGYFVLHFAEDVNVEISRLWSVVSNWNDISWVLGAQDVHVDPKEPYFREITLKGGASVAERLVSKDDDTRTLSYQIVRGSFPVNYYRAELHLAPAADGKTAFQYNLLFVPIGVSAEQAKQVMLDRLKAGAQFISANLGPQPSTAAATAH